MKRLLVLLAFILGFASFTTATFAKDKSDDSHKVLKDLRNDLDFLQKHYDLMKDRVKAFSGDRRMWQEMQDIRADIDRVNAQVDSGNFDLRDIHARIQRSNDDLQAVQNQLDANRSRQSQQQPPPPPRAGGFYQPR